MGFVLACVAGAIAHTNRTMSLGDALYQLQGKLPHPVAALMQGLRRQRATRKNIAFLGTLTGRGANEGTVNKKNVQEAREMLNEMMEQTQEKLDREDISCKEQLANQRATLDETRVDIALYNSQATQAGADSVRAGYSISSLQATLGKSREELAASTADCDKTEMELKEQIEIMVNDSAILQKIVEMVECPKASFLQCRDAQGNTTTTFGKPELRTQMTKLQSNKVKGLLNGAVVLGYSTGEQKVAKGQEPALGEALEDPELPQDQKGCSLATNPNCGKLLDKFIEITGELDSDITKFNEHLETHVEQCQREHDVYKAQIGDITSRLGTWQIALSEASTRETQANEGERLKSEQKAELDAVFIETDNECKVNIETSESEICALGRIRGELFKMSEISEGITDCEVDEWVTGQCSKKCEGGIQFLNREVLSGPTTGRLNAGVKCPPLKLNQTCNTINCPIDCDVSEWSEWSRCSVNCSGGIRERIRSIKQHSRYGGEECGPGSDTEACNTQDCDKPCELTPWSLLSSMRCTKACGGGLKWSVRNIAQAAIGDGACPNEHAPERFRTSTCNTWSCTDALLRRPNYLGDTLLCNTMVDVVILLDGSGSLGPSGWQATQKVGMALVKAFQPLQTYTTYHGVQSLGAQVAVQLFSGPGTWSQYNQCLQKPYVRGWVQDDHGAWEWGWTWPKVPKAADMVKDCGIKWITPMTVEKGHFTTNMKNASTLIEKETWPATSTFTSLALAQAGQELMYSREGVTKVVVVVTDGIPINPLGTTKASNRLKKKARLIWVPVTGNAPEEQLEEWATYPKEQNEVKVADFSTLEEPDVVTQIISEVCPDAM